MIRSSISALALLACVGCDGMLTGPPVASSPPPAPAGARASSSAPAAMMATGEVQPLGTVAVPRGGFVDQYFWNQARQQMVRCRSGGNSPTALRTAPEASASSNRRNGCCESGIVRRSEKSSSGALLSARRKRLNARLRAAAQR